MNLGYTTSYYFQNLVVDRPDDHDMSDGSGPPCTCDRHVAGPGATLNDNSMDIDIDVPLLAATCFLDHQCGQSIHLLLC